MGHLAAACWNYIAYLAPLYWLPFLIVVGLASSVLYAVVATQMVFDKQTRGTLSLAQRIHQLWLNFAGAAAGWAALIFLVARLESVGVGKVGYVDIAIFATALLGIVGFLPQMLLSLVAAIGALIRRIIEKAL